MFKTCGRNNKWLFFSHRLGFGVVEPGGWILRNYVKRELKRVGVTFIEEKQGKEEWMCGGNIVRFLVGMM